MKKLIYLFAACLMSLVVASCGGSSSSDKERIAQLEAQIAELKNDNSTNPTTNEETTYVSSQSSATTQNDHSIVGTYEIKDYMDQVWVLTLNSDETATVSKKGKEYIFYGSWKNTSAYGINLSFSINDDPQIVFPNGEEGLYLSPRIKDGYLYRTESTLRAKNPKERLSISKIK